MNDNRSSMVWRPWLLIAQVIAVSAGLLIAWTAFGPGPVTPALTDIVALREVPHADASASAPNSKADATRIEAGFRAAAAKASASIVNIYTHKAPPRQLPGWLRPYGGSDEEVAQGQSSLGSGVIVAAQGFILTNNHVVEGADEIAVMLPGGKVAEARVVGTDPEADLAVLRVDAKGLQPITFADPTSVQIGDIVLAVGDPFGVVQTVTQGIVSATGRVSRGWLGVSARDVIHETTGAAAGAALVAVQRGGPAERAGLRAGDTVVSVNGKEISDTAALIDETAALSPGTQAQFKVLRGREAIALAVELGQRPIARRQ